MISDGVKKSCSHRVWRCANMRTKLFLIWIKNCIRSGGWFVPCCTFGKIQFHWSIKKKLVFACLCCCESLPFSIYIHINQYIVLYISSSHLHKLIFSFIPWQMRRRSTGSSAICASSIEEGKINQRIGRMYEWAAGRFPRCRNETISRSIVRHNCFGGISQCAANNKANNTHIDNKWWSANDGGHEQ